MTGSVLRMALTRPGPEISEAPDAAPRIARLTACGWQTHCDTESDTGIDMAVSGEAQYIDLGDTIVLGMAFLFNRAEILARLSLSDLSDLPDLSAADGMSDVALLARLWQAEGAAFTEAVSGGFSLVMVAPATGRLTGYRDHFGIFPFYWCIHAEHLTCGSDLRAVLHLSGLPLVPDETRVADFIMGEEIERTRTAFAGLHRLPAAHCLTATRDGTAPTQDSYWSLPDPETLPVAQTPAAFHDHLAAACVASVTPAEGTGAMLSGGLDSTSLAALAARELDARGAPALPTLSFTYPGQPYDESAYIAAANAMYHTQAELIDITDPPHLEKMPDLVEEQMDLFVGYGLQKSRAIYRAGHELGLTRIIDGHGGDEVVSHGYGRLVELAAARQWRSLWHEARGASRIHGEPAIELYLGLVARYGGLPPRSLRRRVIHRLARMMHRANIAANADFKTEDLLAPTLRATLDLEATPRYGQLPDHGTDPQALRQRERADHRTNLNAPLMQHAFEVLHRTASAAGVLPLYPFFDRRLVTFCLALPSEAKLQDGATRWVLREGMRGVLPEMVRTRTTKAEFMQEFRAAITRYIDGGGAPCHEGTEAFVDATAAQRLEAAIRADPDSDGLTMRTYWRLLVLRDWLKALERWRALQSSGELI